MPCEGVKFGGNQGVQLIVERRRQLSSRIFQLDLAASQSLEGIEPGQFFHFRVGDGHRFPLRRPLSVAEVDRQHKTLTIVFRVAGKGTEHLARLENGSSVDALGPLGKGFPLISGAKRVIVVGGGIGVPPLYELGRRLHLAGTTEIAFVLGFRSKDESFWTERFGLVGPTYLYSDDGSLGAQGSAVEGVGMLLAQKKWDALYACGPGAMLCSLKELMSGYPGLPSFVSLEERMGCGVGACYGCVVPTTNGLTARVCADGPVFSLEEVVL